MEKAKEREEIVREETEGMEPPVAKDPPEVASKIEPLWAKLLDTSSIVSLILAVVIAAIVMNVASRTELRPKIWTPDELAKYNGTDKRQPLLLSVLGSVFDVTQGRNHYGPGGGYHHFTGRDASRAFTSGNFTGDGLTDSLQDLTPRQVKSIEGWKNFFEEKYKPLGTLVGRFYDESGKPTKELARVKRLVARAKRIEEEQKADEERFPSCSSRWNPQDGGQVWCKTGYPRIVERVSEGTYKGTTSTRCACYEEKFLNKKDLRLYDGCAATSQKCQSAPPQV